MWIALIGCWMRYRNGFDDRQTEWCLLLNLGMLGHLLMLGHLNQKSQIFERVQSDTNTLVTIQVYEIIFALY